MCQIFILMMPIQKNMCIRVKIKKNISLQKSLLIQSNKLKNFKKKYKKNNIRNSNKLIKCYLIIQWKGNLIRLHLENNQQKGFQSKQKCSSISHNNIQKLKQNQNYKWKSISLYKSQQNYHNWQFTRNLLKKYCPLQNNYRLRVHKRYLR